MVQDGAVTLFRLRGTPIRAHWTLLLTIPYLTMVVSVDFASVSGMAGIEAVDLRLPSLAWGLLLGLGLVASITLHELAHATVARRYGGRVNAITLTPVGGATQVRRLTRVPRTEVIVAAVGPLASLAVGGALFAASVWRSAPSDLRMAAFHLGAMNLALGAFNLVPALPMDAGRIVHVALAQNVGADRATRISAHLGRACAVALVIGGLVSSKILLILVGAYVYYGARSELALETMRGVLAELHAIDLLPPHGPAPTIAEDQRLDAIIARMHALDRLDLVVLDLLHLPIGVIDVHDLATLDPDERWSVTAGALARRHRMNHVAVSADTAANDALDVAEVARADYMIVVDAHAAPADSILGLIAAADLDRGVRQKMLSRPLDDAQRLRELAS